MAPQPVMTQSEPTTDSSRKLAQPQVRWFKTANTTTRRPAPIRMTRPSHRAANLISYQWHLTARHRRTPTGWDSSKRTEHIQSLGLRSWLPALLCSARHLLEIYLTSLTSILICFVISSSKRSIFYNHNNNNTNIFHSRSVYSIFRLSEWVTNESSGAKIMQQQSKHILLYSKSFLSSSKVNQNE